MIPLRVSDVRHWAFCRRVLWHRLMVPHAVAETPKMELGKQVEVELGRLEKRRTGKRYGLGAAERRFGVHLESARLDVRGVCDVVLEVAESEALWPRFATVPEGLARIALRKPRRVHPVDVKRTEGGVGRHHVVQLAGYGMLLEEQEGMTEGSVGVGFVYLLPADEVVAVRLDAGVRGEFERALGEIRGMLEGERFPEGTRHRGYCPQCEYVNFCGDVL